MHKTKNDLPKRVQAKRTAQLRGRLADEVDLMVQPTDTGSIAQDESAYTLNITGVYQDNVTRDWAMQTCLQATKLATVERVQNKLYNVNSLSDPEILQEAVHATLRADVIVVSVYAAEELPLDLYVWFDAWLPRRRSRVGALAALIGVAEPRGTQSVRTHEYLQAVARRGELDFMPQGCKPPIARVSSTNLIAERASITTQATEELHGGPTRWPEKPCPTRLVEGTRFRRWPTRRKQRISPTQ
jgi:hypothetical protein